MQVLGGRGTEPSLLLSPSLPLLPPVLVLTVL